MKNKKRPSASAMLKALRAGKPKNEKTNNTQKQKSKKAKAMEKSPDGDKAQEKAKKSAFPNHIIIIKVDNPQARWYVVHTYSGHEVKVCRNLLQRIETMNLGDKILEILIPTQEVYRIQYGKKQKVTEKLFPGYLLIKTVLDDTTWLAIRTTPGVTGFVGIGNKPTPIAEEEVSAIQKYMSLEAPKVKAKFSVGEAIRIIDGPFAEFIGSVEEINEEKGKVKVLVSIFGRETPVELDFLQVSKL